VRLLLDTHIWIWSHLDREKLSRRVVRALEDPANEIWLSPISVWELLLLVEKGRVIMNEGVEKWIAQVIEIAPPREASLTTEVALATSHFRSSLPDPADAFLAATARVFELTLVTADARLLATRGISKLANR
jgi:PIN domain nuclease of toxin-antitoxin system